MQALPKYVKIPLKVLGGIVGVIIVGWLVVKIPYVNKSILNQILFAVAQEVKDFSVEAEGFDIDVMGSIELRGVLIKDRDKDTLFYAKKFEVVLRKVDLLQAMETKLERISFSDASLYLVKDFSSSDTASDSDLMTQIRAYIPNLPEEINLHRFKMKFEQSVAKADVKILSTQVVLNRDTTANNIVGLFQSIDLESPHLVIYRYEEASSTQIKHVATVGEEFLLSKFMDTLHRDINNASSLIRSFPQLPAVHIKNLNVADESPTSWLNIGSMDIHKNQLTQKDGDFFSLKGKMNQIKCLVQLTKKQDKTHLNMRVGGGELVAEYAIKGDTTSPEVFLSILRANYNSDIFKMLSKKASEGLTRFFVEHLKLHGEIRSTEKQLFVYLQTENPKDLNQVKLISRYSYDSDSLSLDTLDILLGETNVTALNGWLKNKQISIPYELSSLGLVAANGYIVKDNAYNIRLDIEKIGLNAIDKKLTDLLLLDWTTKIEKNASTNFWWKIKQDIHQIKLNKNEFHRLEASYEQQDVNFKKNSFFFRLLNANDRDQAIHVNGILTLDDNKQMEGSVQGAINQLAVNDFYQLDTPLDKLVYSSAWDAQLEQENGTLSILGRMRDLNVENRRNGKHLATPSMAYTLQFAPTGSLISVKNENDSYEVWSRKSSLAKVIDKLIYHHKSLLRDPKYFRQHQLANIKDDGEFELSISSHKVSDILQMLGINASMDKLSLDLKVADEDCHYFVEAKNLNYQNSLRGDLNLRFMAERNNVDFLLKTQYFNMFPSEGYQIMDAFIHIQSPDKVNFGLDAKVDFKNQKQVVVKAGLITTDSMWSELRVDQFLVNTVTDGIWRLSEAKTAEDKQYPIILSDNQQSLKLAARYNRSNEEIDIRSSIEHINLGFLNDLFFKPTFEVKGFANLQVQVKNKITSPGIRADGEIEGLHFNDAPLGDVLAQDIFQNGKMQLNLKSKNPTEDSYFDFKGLMDFSGVQDKFNLNIRAKQISLNWLNLYMDGILSNVNGKFSGETNIFVDNERGSLLLNGKATVHQASFLLNSNNVKYLMEKTNVSFNKTDIEIDNWVLRDAILPASSMVGNFKLTQQNSFDSVSLDINAKASRILLFDTTIPGLPKYSSWFRGGGNLAFKKRGDHSTLKADVQVTEASNFMLRESSPQSVAEESNTVFDDGKIKFGTKREVFAEHDTSLRKKETAPIEEIITVDCKLTVNKKLKVKFFMSEKEEESVGITGDGQISILYKTNAPTQINGEYIIGSMTPVPMGYLSVGLDKNKVSKVYWDGTEMPSLDIHTLAKIKNVDFSSLYNLLGNKEDNLNIGASSSDNLKSDINLLIDVTGSGSDPKIDFDIEVPSSSTVANSQSYRFFLNKFRSNPEFAKKEVGYLVVFNRFMGDNEQTSQSALSANSAVAGAMSSLTTYLLDKSIGQGLMQKAIDKVLPGLNIQLNINSQFTSSSNNATSATTTGDNSIIDQGKINVSVSKSFLSDRLTFSIGSAFDYKIGADNSASSSLSKNQFTTSPSADLKLLLSRESNLFLGLYYRNSVGQIDQMLGIVQQNPSNIVGVNIGVSKEFDSFKDLLKKKSKEKTTKTSPKDKTTP